MRWNIQQIVPMTEFFDTSMVGGLRSYLGKGHHFLPVDVKFIFKKVVVPKLEQGHVETNVGRVQAAIVRELHKDIV